MEFKRLPIGFPSLVHIETFPKTEEPSESLAEIIHQMKIKYGQACSKVDGGLKLTLDSLEGYIGWVEEDTSTLFVALSPKGSWMPSQLSFEEQEVYKRQAKEITDIIPRKLLSTFNLNVIWSKSLEGAHLLLKEYVRQAGCPMKSMGVVRGCLLATLEESPIDLTQPLRRDLVVVSFDHGLEESLEAVWRICWDIASLASYGGQLNQLRLNHDPFLKQIDASEKSTQVRINEIFSSLRLTVGKEEIKGLEDVLREVTTLFSSLSILVSAMRRDYVKAQSLLRCIDTLFRVWNEESFSGYPTNSSIESNSYRNLIAPFEDFINRVDALRVQLNTVLDAVRTYLGIQEQKLSFEEQASSKDLLRRMVRLQEILHKLEILIVAFYITEMGRLIFETVAHEMANILTVAFIPIALLTAIVIRRILHRH